MLKLLYGNVNYGFTNGTVAYSSSFSDYVCIINILLELKLIETYCALVYFTIYKY